MPLVLDASITLCWAFADEDNPVATAALAHMQRRIAHVPRIWWFEVRNTLIVNERRGRISEASTAIFLRALGKLAIHVDTAPDEPVVMTLARQHRLTIYDAAYLELARRGGFALATLDTALRNAASKAGIALLQAAE